MKTTIKSTIKFLLTAFAVISGLSGTIFAETSITKSFEFGPGAQYSSSNFRTFYVPCGLRVEAFVMHQRGGDTDSRDDIPIVIELHSPGTSANDEGPLVAMQEATAKRWVGIGPLPTTTLNGDKSNRGCSSPWIVRVKTASGQQPPVKVFGTIRVSFDNSYKISSGSPFSLDKGDTKTIDIGPSSGLTQGRAAIIGAWGHNLGVMPIQMRFQLIDPDGNVVASKTAYSVTEFNPCCSQNNTYFYYTVPSCKTGQWKLRIKNVSDHDAVDIRLKDIPGGVAPDSYLTTKCP